MVGGARRSSAFTALSLTALAILLPATCNGPESKTMAAAGTGTAADSVLAARFLAGVRGADPVVCGLAARALDMGWRSDRPRVDPAVSDDPASREVVAWALSRPGDAGGVEALANALSDPDPCARQLAARVLGRTTAPEAAAALRAGLGSTNPVEREMAAVGLGHAEDTTALPALIEALGDAEPQVRVAAAWALGEIEDPAAIEALAAMLANDEVAPVREAAAWALGEIE